MIDYQITHWVKSAFSYKGTVLPRILLRVLVMPLTTLVILLAYKGYLFPEIAKDFWKPFWLPPLGHTLIGTALGLVLVFRTNASYDRFWEGRKLWGGIVNASRNLARSARSFGGDLSKLAPLICAFCVTLKHQLRKEDSTQSMRRFLSEETITWARRHPNPALALNLAMSDWLQSMVNEKKIPADMAQRMEQQIAILMDCQGACERILNTPLPFAYVIHVRQLLLFYLFTLPLVLIPELGWDAIPTITILGLGLLGIEEAGIEIEEPFGHEPNDLPLSRICDVIHRDVMALVDFDEPTATTLEVTMSDVNESLSSPLPQTSARS